MRFKTEMSNYPNHYTIQRMSVIIIGIILVLGILAALSNYQPTQTNPIATQLPPPPINTTTVSPPHLQLNITKRIAYYDFLGALEGLNATSTYTFNSTKLFDFGYGYNPLASAIADLLSLPANQITPWTYGEVYNVLDANYTKWASSNTTSLYYYPTNLNESTVYLNFTYQTNPQFVNAYQELNKSYPFPPSDKVTLGSPVYNIINKTSVVTSVILSLSPEEYLVYTYSYPYQVDGMIYCYVYYYYAMNIYGTAYLLANGHYINSQNFMTTFYWYGGSYSNNVYGYVTVPPGVSKEVYANYYLYSYPESYSYTVQEGNKTYIYNFYYPSYPYTSTQGYDFNWYEYNVSLPITIVVYNGTNPVTYVGNQTFHTRLIKTTIWYTVWSSLPKNYSTTIKTLDHILFVRYNLTRTWYAGSIGIDPSCYSTTNDNTVNYYLSFSTIEDINQPPPYVFNPIPSLNKTVVLQWSYFFNNYSIAEGLYNATNKDIDKFNFVLPQFVTALFKNNLTEHTITLASFIEPWNVSKVTLNVSGVLVPTNMTFLPVNITANTSYSLIYSALGSPNTVPNVTLLSYKWNNLTDSGYFPPLQDALYNGTLPPAYYSPFTNKILLNYGVYWSYGLPYAQFSIQQEDKVYNYWYNPGWKWFPIN